MRTSSSPQYTRTSSPLSTMRTRAPLKRAPMLIAARRADGRKWRDSGGVGGRGGVPPQPPKQADAALARPVSAFGGYGTVCRCHGERNAGCATVNIQRRRRIVVE